MLKYRIPTLTIAGSDSSGGAGIQADLKTFGAIGTYGMSVITAITAQNTRGVFDVLNIDTNMIQKQIEVVFDDIEPKALKIGMLSNANIIRAVSKSLSKYKPKYLVVDPVMISKSGFSLLQNDAKEELIKKIIPLAYIVTPNIEEAFEITGINIRNTLDMEIAGRKILELGTKYVLMKGGHLEGDAVDILIGKNLCVKYIKERVKSKNTHGTGCTLSAGITAYLALGYDIQEAVKLAKDYITLAIQKSFDIGGGIGPVNHFYNFE